MAQLCLGRRARTAHGGCAVAAGLAAALLTGPVPARAEADGPDYFRVTGVSASDVLNIRAAPDAGALKVGAIPPHGDGIQNLGCEGGLSIDEWQSATLAERAAGERRRWCQIAYQGMQGWVAARFLGEGSAPAGGGLWAVTGVAGDDVLNVRAAPSAGAPVVGALAPYESGITNYGCEVPAFSNGQWCRIELGGVTGWVAGRFLIQR